MEDGFLKKLYKPHIIAGLLCYFVDGSSLLFLVDNKIRAYYGINEFGEIHPLELPHINTELYNKDGSIHIEYGGNTYAPNNIRWISV